jgi:hypothetical protein
MERPVHFEITADNPEQAVKFYTKVFGWEIKKWEGPMEYWLVMTGPKEQPGIDGGLMRRSPPITTGTVNTVGVASLDESIKKVVASGGKVVRPKSAVPRVGWFAYCADTEGNIFGMMQPDTSAK